MRTNKQFEVVLIEQGVKKTIQTLYDKELFDKYDNADEVLKNYLIIDEFRGTKGWERHSMTLIINTVWNIQQH